MIVAPTTPVRPLPVGRDKAGLFKNPAAKSIDQATLLATINEVTVYGPEAGCRHRASVKPGDLQGIPKPWLKNEPLHSRLSNTQTQIIYIPAY